MTRLSNLIGSRGPALKRIIIINGTMGIGKTTACLNLYKTFDSAIWLDGDWSWMMHPWKLNDKIIDMVFDNITYTLRNFINSGEYETILFNWVLHTEEWIQRLLDGLGEHDYRVQIITLTCKADVLLKRLEADHRNENVKAHALERLQLYEMLDTEHLDTTHLDSDAVARALKDSIIAKEN